MPDTDAYVTGFEYDIFISYAHVDNRPGGDAGWVAQLHKALNDRLATRFGRAGIIRIWRDPALDGSEVFKQVLEARVRASAVFVALTSNGYLASDYCRQELAAFYRAAQQSPYGVQVGERRRLLNVLLTNLRPGEWPEELRGTTGFSFHDAPPDDEDVIGEPLKTGSEAFDSGVRKLTDATCRLLKEFREQIQPAPEPPRPRAIFLASTSAGLRELRGRVAADLRHEGREVITGIPPPSDSASHDREVAAAVASASLSVHLLDGDPGDAIRDEPDATYPRRQLELATASVTPQMIWVPPALEIEAVSLPSHRELLSSFERGPRLKETCEFVREPETRMAQVILDRVRRLETATRTGTAEPTILLDTHLKDQRVAFEMSSWLLDLGIQPFIHQESDNPAEGITAFEGQLQRSSTVVIFFGKVAKSWVEQRVNSVLQFVMRQISNGLTPSLQECYVYLLPPVKQALQLRTGIYEPRILDNTASDRFEPAAAAPLLVMRGGAQPA
jgi:hypothetical protein